MVSVKAIESEVFGSCVDAIDLSAEVDVRDVLFRCGKKYPRFI
jgi:hypothetical protein